MKYKQTRLGYVWATLNCASTYCIGYAAWQHAFWWAALAWIVRAIFEEFETLERIKATRRSGPHFASYGHVEGDLECPCNECRMVRDEALITNPDGSCKHDYLCAYCNASLPARTPETIGIAGHPLNPQEGI